MFSQFFLAPARAYRRCLLRWLVVLAGFLVFGVPAGAQVPPMPVDPLMASTVVCPVSSSTQLLCLTNFARRKAGLVPVVGSPSLYGLAKLKAQRIVECRSVSHEPCGDLFVRPPLFSSFGENLCSGYVTIRAAFRAWLGSAPHRANILRPYYRLYGSARISFSTFRGSPVWVVLLGS